MWIHDQNYNKITDDEFVERIQVDLRSKSGRARQVFLSIVIVSSIVILELMNVAFAQSFVIRVVAGSIGGLYSVWFVNRRAYEMLVRYYNLAHELGRRVVAADESALPHDDA